MIKRIFKKKSSTESDLCQEGEREGEGERERERGRERENRKRIHSDAEEGEREGGGRVISSLSDGEAAFIV